MLTKLLKYDFKTLFKSLTPIYLIAIFIKLFVVLLHRSSQVKIVICFQKVVRKPGLFMQVRFLINTTHFFVFRLRCVCNNDLLFHYTNIRTLPYWPHPLLPVLKIGAYCRSRNRAVLLLAQSLYLSSFDMYSSPVCGFHTLPVHLGLSFFRQTPFVELRLVSICIP